MTMKRRNTLGIALAAFPMLATAALHPNLPEKLKNATPQMRAAYGYPDIPDPPSVSIESLRRLARPDAPSCANVKVSAPVNFRGRKLVEIPDITEPDLRLSNQLMSSGCFTRAVDKLETVVRADPGNRNAKYLFARMVWMWRDTATAERELTQALEAHPDFVSGKVLLAGIRFEQQKVPEAVRLLDEVETRSPTDLWIYMNRLRVEGLRSPSMDLRTRLLEIVRNPAFPPNARQVAGDIAKQVPNQTKKDFEEVQWAQFDADSTPNASCLAVEIAFGLSEGGQRHTDVIKLLESPRGSTGFCANDPMRRTLLAQAYLMEAAKISPRPGPANQKLIDKADKLVNGDYTGVAKLSIGRQQAATLAPFLEEYVHPEEQGSNGQTTICTAIDQLNVAAVRAQLDAGADVNGRCGSESLVSSLIFMATVNKDEQRRDIMTVLLERGAPLTKANIASCRSRDNGDCHEVMLPVMEKYSARAR